MKIVVLIILLACFELAVFALCSSGRLRERLFAKRIGRGFVFIAAQAVLLTFLSIGVYVQLRWDIPTRISEFTRRGPVVQGLPVGQPSDPGLLRTLDQVQSKIARPDLSDTQAFRQWQGSLRSHLLQSVFKIPEISRQGSVRFERSTHEEVSANLTRTRIVFQSFDGSHIPGYLFEPSQIATAPAILVIPGHASEGQSGLAQTSGLVESYQHAAALNLAKAGFITLSLELRGFGELGLPYNTEHRLVAWNAILAGTFYKAIMVRDLKFAVDLLSALPTVDPARIGITGASYGGELAVTYAALDERIKAVSSHSFGGRLGRRSGVTGTKRDQPHYCHIIPGSSEFLHEEDMFLLAAPRPAQVVRGERDGFKDPDFGAGLLPAWRAFQLAHQVQVLTVPGGHEYFPEPAIEFFRFHL